MVDRPGTVSYQSDTLSRPTSETRAFTGVGSFTLSYAYDHLGRLSASHSGVEARMHLGEVAWGSEAPDGPYAHQYYYDVWGNITERIGWDGNYLRLTSVATFDELHRGDHPHKKGALELVSALPLLAVEEAVFEIVEAYIRHKLMPADPVGDALHLAVASYHRCDFLLTWNCRHLANANKFGHIRRVNGVLGLYVPSLVTPLELLGGQADEG